MTYNTGNPIGSSDPRDLRDNAQNIDIMANSPSVTSQNDRLGTPRKTLHGMEVEHDAQIVAHEAEFQDRIAGMAFTRVGTFSAGYTLTDARQVLLYETDGHEYGWTGAFPKIVPPASTPAGTGGVGAGAWVDRSDVTLRSDLNVVVKVFESVADMKADTSLIVSQKCRTLGYYSVGDGGGNDYEIVAAATGTNDGGSYIDLSGSGFQANGLFIDGVVSTRQFGDYEDYSRTTETGTNCAIYIQSAINYCYNNGIGELYKYGDSLYTQIIVVPSGLSIIGSGKEISGMFRDKSDLSGRGIIVGTYGPRNSIHPGLETPYSITAAVIGNDYVDVSVSDSANFSVGDLVYIQGTGFIAGDTAIMTPNHGGRVTEVNYSTGRIYLDFVVDDNYAPGSGGQIRKMNTGDPVNTIADQTGYEWGLFVAVNSSIKSMTLSNAPTATWPIINLSTYECVFDDIHYDGNQPFSGNPVVKTNFTNSTGGYGNRVYEFAYISHDNLLSDCRFVRLYDETPFSSFAYAMWDNNTEGCKRTTIRRVYVDDFDPTVQTLYLAYLYKSTIDDCILKSRGSSVRNTEGTTKNSTIYWSFKVGFSGYAHGIRLGGKDVAINNNIISVSPSSGNGILVRATDDVTAIGNHLFSYDGTQTSNDTIKLDWTAGTPRAEISENKTYLSDREFYVFKREPATATPSSSTITLPSYGTWLVTVWSNLADSNHATTGTFLVNYLDAVLDILSTQQVGSSRVSTGDTFGLTGVTLSNPSSSGVLTAGITWTNGLSYEPNFMFSAKLLSSISNAGLA